MTIRNAVLALLAGFGFLAGSAFNFLDRSRGMKVGPSLLEGMVEGFGMLWVDLGLFLLAFALVHAAAGWLSAWALEPIARRVAPQAPGKLVLLAVLAGILWLVLQNAAIFPHSMLGSSFHDFADSTLGTILRWAIGLSIGTGLVAGLALRTRAAIQPSEWIASHALWAIPAIAALVFTAGWLVVDQQKPFPTEPDKPHVILVGIDGWRLEAFRNSERLAAVMPFVARFAEKSASVEETVTPLARTYPAWWTIFSGQFPPRHGARFNLIPDEFIETPLHLPVQLGERGYHRILAMDERRFANFRPEQGFDEIIGPASGAADFLIAGLHDTPLVNMLVNTAIGRILFPYLHANRAADHTYYPETFDVLLADAIDSAPRKPLFLAAHFELPHWPFTWAREPTGKFLDMAGDEELASYYEALEATDRQLRNLFASLHSNGVLENAIVVLLSDHGEALPVDNRTWTYAETKSNVTTPVGHGTHVLGLQEYRIPLLFRGFGLQHIPPGEINGRASLADVYPTISDALALKAGAQPDGISLLPYMLGALRKIPKRSLPVESGFNPDVFTTGPVQPGALVTKGIAHYNVIPDGRLVLKSASVDEFMQRKKRAIINGNQILMPLGRDPMVGDEKWLLADIQRQELRQVRHPSDFNGKHAELRQDFCRFFGNDPAIRRENLCKLTPGAGNAAD